jgi:hypothetical protein
LQVAGYSPAEDKYVVSWDATASTSLVHRLELCFAAEDPVNFAQRVGFAFRYVALANVHPAARVTALDGVCLLLQCAQGSSITAALQPVHRLHAD